MKEYQLFAPIKTYFEDKGYSIYAEVKNCDVIAQKEKEIIIIEMKLRFNIKIIYQALDRQKISDKVYVALPRPKKNKEYIKKILKSLELGLIIIENNKIIEIFEPLKEAPRNNKRKRELIKEIEEREIDDNIGGINNKKINTAYRQKAAKIAKILLKIGPSSAKEIIKNYNCPKESREIMYRNYYGWFERAGNGIYMLSDLGKKEAENV